MNGQLQIFNCWVKQRCSQPTQPTCCNLIRYGLCDSDLAGKKLSTFRKGFARQLSYQHVLTEMRYNSSYACGEIARFMPYTFWRLLCIMRHNLAEIDFPQQDKAGQDKARQNKARLPTIWGCNATRQAS